LAVLPVLGGDESSFWWVLASLISGAIYRVIGPSFWRLLRSIRESAISKMGFTASSVE
jgi:hypothetical protein